MCAMSVHICMGNKFNLGEALEWLHKNRAKHDQNIIKNLRLPIDFLFPPIFLN